MATPTTPMTPRAGLERRSDQFGAGRITLVVVASLVALVALAALGAGGAALILDQTQRDASGYLMTDSTSYSTGTYAFVSDSYRAGVSGDVFVARDMLGTVRLDVQSTAPVFVGIARANAVDGYLAAVRREQGASLDSKPSDFELLNGAAPNSLPSTQRFWAASTTGSGAQTLRWQPEKGDWRVVLMNADGSAGVNADLAIGARFPDLLAIGLGVAGGGAVLLLLASVGLYRALRRKSW